MAQRRNTIAVFTGIDGFGSSSLKADALLSGASNSLYGISYRWDLDSSWALRTGFSFIDISLSATDSLGDYFVPSLDRYRQFRYNRGFDYKIIQIPLNIEHYIFNESRFKLLGSVGLVYRHNYAMREVRYTYGNLHDTTYSNRKVSNTEYYRNTLGFSGGLYFDIPIVLGIDAVFGANYSRFLWPVMRNYKHQETKSTVKLFAGLSYSF